MGYETHKLRPVIIRFKPYVWFATEITTYYHVSACWIDEGGFGDFWNRDTGDSMKYQAYWMNVSGEIIPVDIKHIIKIIEMPERFSYTRERIEYVFARYNEPIGHEGKAREAIMSDLIKNYGWIRFRFTPKKDSWIIELNVLTDEIMEQIKALFKQPDVVGKSSHANVRIIELFTTGGMKKHSFSMNELLHEASNDDFYAKVSEIDPLKTSKMLKEALDVCGMSVQELSSQIHYCSLERSKLKVTKILDGLADGYDLTVLRAISNILGIDREEFVGEKIFTDPEEYNRFFFVPHLMRVGTETRPTSIAIGGYVGLKRCFLVSTYETLKHAQVDVLLKEVRQDILADNKDRSVPFFGTKIGYVFYPEYGKAIPLTLSGEIREDVVVCHSAGSCGIYVGGHPLLKIGGVNIPRLETKTIE